MEDWGLIDKEQKGVIKDLVISEDQNTLTALDKFETGDTSYLKGNLVIYNR
jgi:hypothetical protein